NCLVFGHTAGFKQFLNSGQTSGNITAGSNTTGVEGSQGQLCTRFTDGLGGNNTNSRAKFDHFAPTKVGAITTGTNAVNEFTGQWRTHKDLVNISGNDLIDQIFRDQIVAFCEDFPGFRVNKAGSQKTSNKAISERLTGNIIGSVDPNAFFGAAIFIIDNDILGNVHQTAGQITSFCRTQSRICQTFSGTMGGNEVFQRRKSFTEVGTDRHRNNTTRWVSNQTAHTSHL